MDLVVQGQIRAGKLLWRPSGENHAVTVVCKVSFELLPDMSPVANTQHPIIESDVYSARGGMLLATDLVPFKKRPEVLVIGSVHAHAGRPVPSLLARLAMNEIDKSVLVVGDRVVNRLGQASDPKPFTSLPLVWDRAGGGPDTINPVGKIFGMVPGMDSPAPNLYPADANPLKFGHVAPVSLGPIAPNWPTRIACLRQRVANWDFRSWHNQPLPSDIDIAYLNAAPHDQQRSTPFGEDAIYLQHLHPHHAQLSTRLAPVNPVVTVDRGNGPEPLKLRCDTMLIDTDRSLVMLVWRAHVVLAHPAQMCKIVVEGPSVRAAAAIAIADDSDDEATLIPVKAFHSRASTVPLPDQLQERTAGFPGAHDIADGTHTIMGTATTQSPVLPFDPSQAVRPQVFSAPAPMPATRAESDIEDTIAPLTGPRAPALPFGSTANVPQGPPPAPSQPAFSPNPAGSWPVAAQSDLEEETAYLTAGHAQTGAALPFAANAKDSPAATIARLVAENTAMPRPKRDDSDLEGQTAYVPAGQARPGVVLPFASAPNVSPAPAVAAPQNPPMTLGQLATTDQAIERRIESQPKAEQTPALLMGDTAAKVAATEPRDPVQVILQAIWKGDRSLQEVLAEHGLTEVQWRAMKRGAARK